MSYFLAYTLNKKTFSSQNYLNQNIKISKKKKNRGPPGPQAVWSLVDRPWPGRSAREGGPPVGQAVGTVLKKNPMRG